MKRILSLLAAAILSLPMTGQVDRSQRPEAGPAPKLEFGDYKVEELKNGIKLIVVEDHKLPRINMQLILDRDPILEGEDAGYVQLAGEMMRQGTTNRPKDKLDEEIDFIGARLSTSSNSVSVNGLSKYTDKLVELMADVVLHPAFPQEEFDKLKKQQISGLESQKDDPSAVASNVHNAMMYGLDHPYGEMITIESTEKVKLEDVKSYYKNYWIPNYTYIAIVGDIKPREAKKLVKKYLGDWERHNEPRNTYPTPQRPEKTQVNFVNRESSVQSVIEMGNTMDLKPGSPDIVALELANQVLGGGSLGRLFQNIREDKGYTYGAYSSVDDDRLVGEFNAGASVRNEVTDSAIVEFMKEFERLRNEPVSEDELAAAKAFITGSFGRSLESPGTIASFALNIERYDLPKDYYENYLKRLADLSAQDVMNAAKKYITPERMQITVVGKASEVAEKLEKFGKVSYYNEKGEEVEKPSTALPEGLTAEQVINDYIKALGGKEALQKVKDVKITYDVSIPGAPALSGVEMRKRPGMYKQEITMQGQTIQKMVFDGSKGSTSGMQVPGGSKSLEGDELDEAKEQAQFFPETNYLSDEYTLDLVSMGKVDNKSAYVVKVTDKNGETTTEYYSAETGLKLKEESTQEGPQGPMTVSTTYSDYKAVNGVQYPHMMVQDVGPQKIKMDVKEIKINSGLKDEEFKS